MTFFFDFWDRVVGWFALGGILRDGFPNISDSSLAFLSARDIKKKGGSRGVEASWMFLYIRKIGTIVIEAAGYDESCQSE